MHVEGMSLVAVDAIYALAYVVGIAAFAVMAKRRGIATDGIAVVAAAALLAGALGAQVAQVVFGGVPGKSLIGGVACGFIAVLLAKRALGIERSTGDAFAFAIALGESVGRIGCLFAGCCYGKAAHVAWAIAQHGALRHPTQIYSSIAALATFALLVVLERRRALPEGASIYVQGACLCATRFVIEFYRDGTTPAFGLTTVQLACTFALIFCTYRLARLLVPRGAAVVALAR